MFASTCPSCAAPLQFKAASSTTAICQFCKSTVARDSDTLKLIGKQAELLQDFSRLQISTEGQYDSHAFTVIGRIQMRYDAGVWNEWYVLFADTKTAWLSETASGFTLLRSVGGLPNAVVFDNVVPGQSITINQQAFNVTDKRIAQCVAAQGELPFAVDNRWESKTLDLKVENQFLTFDFSDGGAPEVYRGVTLTAEQLQLKRLKDTQDRFTGATILGAIDSKTITQLSCKACGSPIKLAPALSNIVCPACSSELHQQEGSLILDVERANQQRVWTALEPGDNGEMFGYQWTVMGVMTRHDASDSSEKWDEYLLYHADQGLRWLSFADGEWQWIQILDSEPTQSGKGYRYDNVYYTPQSQYTAATAYVAGAFNWRAKRGNLVKVEQFTQGANCLSRESTDSEVTWSLGRKTDGHLILKAFGKGTSTSAKTPYVASAAQTESTFSLPIVSIYASAALLLVVGPAWLSNRVDPPIEETLFGLLALWVPQFFFNQSSSD
jgi:uncharacterized Zn finger protein (UPF0148 family)